MVRSLVLAALLAVGCGGDDGNCDTGALAAEPVCESGKSEVCACADGAMGAQVCAADGLGWGACECEPIAGGEGGAGNEPTGRPYAYEASEVCQVAADPQGMCKMIGGASYTKPYGSCALPKDGVLVYCIIVSAPESPLAACCG